MWRESLVKVLFGSPIAARAAAVQLSVDEGWAWAFRSAETWNVVPQLSARIETLGLEPPVTQREAFKRVLIETFARCASRGKKGAVALQRLDQAGIPALAFKGLASMARLYPTPAKRTIRDADILVAPERVRDAVESLSGLNFTVPDGYDLDRWDHFLDRSPGFSRNKAIALAEPGGFEIDLHWSLGLTGMKPDLLLSRSDSLTLFGCSFRGVSVGDALILTARHSIRENLAVDFICRDLFDIQLSCHWLATHGDMDPVLDSMARSASIVPLLALTQVLVSLADEREVRQVAGRLSDLASPTERQSAEHLQQLFFEQVSGGPIGKDLLYLSHSRPAKQILAGAVTNWREYRTFMRSMEEKLDGEVDPLGRRVWNLASSLKDLGLKRWRGIRELGRLKYGDDV